MLRRKLSRASSSSRRRGRGLAFEPLEERCLLSFAHPGILSTQADLDRMEAKVAAAAEPWKASWDILVSNTDAWLGHTPEAVSTVYVGGGTSENYIRLARDAARAYQLSLRYHGSGNTDFADKAVEILNAWASTHTSWSGDTNVSLRAVLYGYQFASAAELLRDYSGWDPADFTAFQDYMINEFYTLNTDFLSRRHGTVDTHYWANWTLSNVASMMAIGVLTDRQDIFDEGINYIYSGPGTEAIENAVVYVHPNGLGQWQESGRDQGHSLMGPQLLGVISEIAWNQGIDLYSYDNNRFLASVEYISKYNLGNDVPFAAYAREYGHPGSSVFEVHWSISSASRGQLRPGWDLVYNHYVNRMGLAAPYTQEYATMVRPEGGGFNYGGNSGGSDGLGFTTLTHSLDPIDQGAVPSALRTSQQDWQVTLSWAGSAYAESYNVKRSTTSDGPYTTIATVGPKNLFYVDAGLDAGTTYYYVVSANNPAGESADSDEAAVVAVATGGDTMQAEDASVGGGAVVENSHGGFNGTGFVNFDSTGGYVEFTGIDGGEGGEGGPKPLETRYALGNQNRTALLIVNGVSQEITVPSTGTWTNWKTQIWTVTLNSGTNNTIRIQSNGEDFGNVDQLTVKNSTASPSETTPSTPNNLSATTVSMSQIDLSWNAVAGADSYNIKRATSSGGPYVILDNQAGTSFSDTGLLARSAYHYVVSAVNSAGESAASAVASAVTSDTITIQAEGARRGGGAIFENTNSGFNGSGYVNFNSSGGFVEFTSINGGSGGTASLDIRYALGNTNRTGRLIVNGVAQDITVAGTGAWTNWASHQVDVTLNSGANNTIRIESIGQDFGNVDEITVTVSNIGLPTLFGDYNLDNVVDAADYTMWRDHLGSSVPAYSGADGSGDGHIDGSDYDVWKANFGQTAEVQMTAPLVTSLPLESRNNPSTAETESAIDAALASFVSPDTSTAPERADDEASEESPSGVDSELLLLLLDRERSNLNGDKPIILHEPAEDGTDEPLEIPFELNDDLWGGFPPSIQRYIIPR